VITRTIMPIINQPSPAPRIPSAFGLGDINPSLLGNGKWEAGPALVILSTPGTG
jgi:hypothetical protein